MKQTKSFREILIEVSAKKGACSQELPSKMSPQYDFKSQVPLVDMPLYQWQKVIENRAHNEYTQWIEHFPLHCPFVKTQHERDSTKQQSHKNLPEVQWSDLSAIGQVALHSLSTRGAQFTPNHINEKQIKSAYRKLARQLHPDLNQDHPVDAQDFHAMHEEYRILLSSFNEALN